MTPESDPLLPDARPRVAMSREPFGWIALALLFAALAYAALVGASRRPSIGASTDALEARLKLAVSISANPASGRTALADLARELASARDPRRVYIAGVVARERGLPVDAPSLRRAGEDPSIGSRRVGLVADERPVGASLPSAPKFVDRLAAAQAAERSGTPRATARRGLADPTLVVRAGVLWIGGLAIGAAGIAAWLVYFVQRGSPSFVQRGEPSLPMTPAQADRFAWRGAGMFLAFLIGSQLSGWIGRRSGAVLGDGAQFATFVALAIYSWRMRAARGTPMIAATHLRGPRPWRSHIVWGVAAAVANVPVALLLGAVLAPLLRGAPTPVHPTTEALLAGPGFLAIMRSFVVAAICAPLWEETFLRGLFFQGLRGVGLAFWGAAGLSSFLFAAIHPQGVAAWAPIFSLAMISCALVRQTRSLVPSLVMHAVWNSVALFAALLVGPLAG